MFEKGLDMQHRERFSNGIRILGGGEEVTMHQEEYARQLCWLWIM